MAENELQILIKGIFSRIKEKYGYTDEQSIIYLKGYEDCAKEHQQSLEKRDKMLRDTVAELCEAKRLLKAAVKDFRILGTMLEDGYGHCTAEIGCDECVLGGGNLADDCQWCHEAEVLKLIGEVGDTE
ncbi:hypothetical protein [Ruminococcus sp.]|uniref:hypothetical protein n=1 Tax=Ruminococcus sp. TaxID=41978 RepID=UPI0025DBF16D|nr:hypothetical protein [Ruminococcus sp.]MBQ6250188.1 hypothetical protein [Ruminococcus sp.]